MLLKKASIVSVLALAVGVSSVGAVSAATVTKASVVQVNSSAFIVNGVPVNINTFIEKGKTLVGIRDLSNKLGADIQTEKSNITVSLNGSTVEMKLNSKVIDADGVEITLEVPVKSLKGTGYVELQAFVEALGGHFLKDDSGNIWLDADLLGGVDHIQWLDSARLIASQETDSGRLDFLVDALSTKYEKLRIVQDASDLILAPNGTKAAYTNAAGEVYVYDFNAKSESKVSSDTSIKPELVWSADSSAIYFLQGDKGSVIAKLDLAAGTISKILEDKVDYKANLDVSIDGKTFTYTVTKPGAVVADGSKPVESDDVTIDMKGTEPQIFAYTVDPSIKDNKAVQLTTSTDDKVFIHAAADGSSVSYVAVSDDAAAKSILVTVGKDKTVKTLFAEKDIFEATYAAGKWYLLTEGTASSQFVYEVDSATGAAKQLYTVSDSVSEVVAKAGSPIAVINDGKVFLSNNGLWKPTTR
ncbi:stalk domain-containing protein [Cohnella abietis]|uniref:Copper amine oxidase-like N-terminal domain-containing protein n=1 Tax=Cohnella abietis TaxID=2507935 RepID=A0A3T1D9Z6_9BACL|nr:stalk domain-containing protein [Cohnella abietis]BBI34936.1 hypothetical protein KCTCHS21_43350 [Cohnella abietis]